MVASAGSDVPSPMAIFLLDKFSHVEGIRGHLAGEFTTGSWTGPASNHYAQQIAQLEGWAAISLPRPVRDWARELASDIGQMRERGLRMEAERRSSEIDAAMAIYRSATPWSRLSSLFALPRPELGIEWSCPYSRARDSKRLRSSGRFLANLGGDRMSGLKPLSLHSSDVCINTVRSDKCMRNWRRE